LFPLSDLALALKDVLAVFLRQFAIVHFLSNAGDFSFWMF
jgi:hypothetical protein